MQHATNRDYRRWVAQLDKCENAINKIQDMKLVNSFGMKVICLEPNKSADSA